MKTAIVVGATGLVGAQILTLLLAHPDVEQVMTLGRRKTGKEHAKLSEHVVDLASPEALAAIVRGDVLFSALGTTLRQAGSQAAQRLVDVDYPLNVARAAAANGVRGYGLVSSLGADAGSSLFYNRIKGELERDVSGLGFQRVRIARPSVLLGERSDHRPMEAFGASAAKLLGFVPGLRRYRPIEGRTVARALLRAVEDGADGVQILEPEQLFALGAES